MPLPSGWDVKIQKVHGASAFAWCWLIPLHVDATLNLNVALTDYSAPVTIAGIKYYPYPMKQSAIEDDGDGNLPQLSLQLSNSHRLLAPYLESPGDERGMFGRVAEGRLVAADSPGVVVLYKFEIQSATLDDNMVSLRLEQRNLL